MGAIGMILNVPVNVWSCLSPVSMPGLGLRAHMLVLEFDDHTPLHRLNETYARMGADVPDSTLLGWVAGP